MTGLVRFFISIVAGFITLLLMVRLPAFEPRGGPPGGGLLPGPIGPPFTFQGFLISLVSAIAVAIAAFLLLGRWKRKGR